MGFKQDNFAKIWKTTIYEKYTTVELSTSKKNKQTNEYEVDFQHSFVKFIGQAHRDAVSLKRGDKIKIGECEVTRKYSKEKQREYIDFLVYTFTLESSAPNASGDSLENATFMNIPDDVVGELPFS